MTPAIATKLASIKTHVAALASEHAANVALAKGLHDEIAAHVTNDAEVLTALTEFEASLPPLAAPAAPVETIAK